MQKTGFRVFSPAARKSGGEQRSPISFNKSERSLTQVSMVKVVYVSCDE
jgi:hypothetical protein